MNTFPSMDPLKNSNPVLELIHLMSETPSLWHSFTGVSNWGGPPVRTSHSPYTKEEIHIKNIAPPDFDYFFFFVKLCILNKNIK